MKNFIGNFFRARKQDPITSHLAAESIKQTASQHFQLIHECLREHGPLSKDGIARHTGLTGNQIARRLSEMEKMKLIKETGKLVKSDAGRKEREWEGL
jgi:predicted ArsR family transcriptional regulator